MPRQDEKITDEIYVPTLKVLADPKWKTVSDDLAIIIATQGFIPSERATNSTAKPAVKEATPSDALLMMNVVMALLQYCLQKVMKVSRAYR